MIRNIPLILVHVKIAPKMANRNKFLKFFESKVLKQKYRAKVKRDKKIMSLLL